MLRFFSKKRWQLAKDNQFFKYSRYAIGEIVLVVIGILIALYINHWDEVRQEREKFDQTLVEVEKELIYNIEYCRNALDYQFTQDSLVSIVLYDTLTVEDYKNNRFLRDLIGFDLATLTMSTNAFNKLSQVDVSPTPRQDSIKSGLIELYEIIVFIRKHADQLEAFNIELFKSYESFGWYNDWRMFQHPPERIDYLMYDPDHKRNVIKYSGIVLGNLRFYIEQFEIRARKNYEEIYDYLNERDQPHIDSLHFQYNAANFEHYVGTYIRNWESYDHVEEDSTVINIEGDKLYYTPYYPDGTNSKREIIPISKYRFRTEKGWGFYRFTFDEQGKVIGTSSSAGLAKNIDIKKR